MWWFHKLCSDQEGMYLCLFAHPEIFHPPISFFSLRDLPCQGLEHLFRNTDLLASDGTSVNSSIKKGIISLIIKENPWVGFVWCFAHRLELALKQVLKEWFKPITCLMNLYYLYEKSSKKLRELKVLHELLKEIYKFEDDQVNHIEQLTHDGLHRNLRLSITC